MSNKMISMFSLASALAFTVGCGGSKASTHWNAKTARAHAGPDVRAMVLPEAKAVFYLNGDLAKLPSDYKEGFASLAPMGGEHEGSGALDKLADACDFDLDTDIEEVVFSVESEESFAAAARLRKPANELVDCVVDQGHKRIDIEGNDAVMVEDVVLMAVGNVAVLGGEEEVESVSSAAPPRWLKWVADYEGTLLGSHMRMNAGGISMMSVTLRGDIEDLELVVTFRGKTAADADLMAATFKATLPSVALEVAAEVSDGSKRLEQFLGSSEVRRTVTHGVEIVIPIGDSSPKRVKRHIAALKMFTRELGARVDRKRSENDARAILWNIAERMRGYASEHKSGLARLPAFPRSAPLTPRKVPQGVFADAKANDWRHATWRALDFSLEGQHRYSYQIETSIDRRRATLRAVADQDGDGKRQVLELELFVRKDGQLTHAPFIQVDNALE